MPSSPFSKAPPDVAVVLASYNGEKYIAQQLESIRSQTLQPKELIVTDDCSRDETLSIVSNFAKTSPFPVTILKRAKNVGWADNFIFGLGQIRPNATAVALCDQDDVWHKNKLELQTAAMTSDPRIALVSHSWKTLRNESIGPKKRGALGRLPRFKQGDAAQLPNVGTPGMTMLLRADVAKNMVALWPQENVELSRNHGFWILPHDIFAIDIAIALGDIVTLPQQLAYYREHNNNVCNFSKNDAISANWPRHHKGVDVWSEYGLRYAEWAKLYYRASQKCRDSEIGEVLALRAGKYLNRSEAFMARASIYLDDSFSKRRNALGHLFRQGYAEMGKNRSASALAWIRDLAAVFGWR